MFSLGCIQALKCNKNTCPTGITTHDPRFQKGLVPREKYKNVAAYAKQIVKEVETIAHSCGVPEPRELRRHHVRVVRPDGRTQRMDELFPRPDVV
jgi:glutamate synthase domain-containing protein 2